MHGYHRVIMVLETKPKDDATKIRWFNKCDEAFGTLYMYVSLDLPFYIKSTTTPNRVWKTL